VPFGEVTLLLGNCFSLPPAGGALVEANNKMAKKNQGAVINKGNGRWHCQVSLSSFQSTGKADS